MNARHLSALCAAALALAGCSPGQAADPSSQADAVGAQTIQPGYAVRGQIAAGDVAEIARAGYRMIINNRPDGEEPGQPSSAQIEAEAKRQGLAYLHIPVAHSGATAEQAQLLARTLAASPGPILAYCRSGRRAAALRAMADQVR